MLQQLHLYVAKYLDHMNCYYSKDCVFNCKKKKMVVIIIDRVKSKSEIWQSVQLRGLSSDSWHPVDVPTASNSIR